MIPLLAGSAFGLTLYTQPSQVYNHGMGGIGLQPRSTSCDVCRAVGDGAHYRLDDKWDRMKFMVSEGSIERLAIVLFLLYLVLAAVIVG